MLRDADMLDGIVRSLELACLSTALAVAVGTTAALLLQRTSSRWRGAAAALLMSPLSVPLVLTAFAMLVLFTRLTL